MRKTNYIQMKLFIIFLLFLLLSLNSCKKKQYCIYRRFDLPASYLLRHPTKISLDFRLNYNYSNPYNVYLEDSCIKILDSMIKLEGYNIDTSFKNNGYSYKIEGNCQYCLYYHTFSQDIFCEPQ